MGYFKSENVYSQRISQKEVSGLVEKARNKFNIPAMFVATLNNESMIAHEVQGVRMINTDYLVTIEIIFILAPVQSPCWPLLQVNSLSRTNYIGTQNSSTSILT